MFKDGIMPSTAGYKNDLEYGLSSRYLINMGKNKYFKTKMGLIPSLLPKNFTLICSLSACLFSILWK